MSSHSNVRRDSTLQGREKTRTTKGPCSQSRQCRVPLNQAVPPQSAGTRSTDPEEDARNIEQKWEPEENQLGFERDCDEVERKHPELKVKDNDGWTDLSNTLRDADEHERGEINENIDTILVFSGLFSATITSLIIDAYKLLQRDQTEANTQVLLQISQQLTSFAITGGAGSASINSTSVPASLPPFTPDSTVIWLNALWFSALVLSLITASIGMLVKQWFREYMTGPYVAPRERCRVRQYRKDGLLRYRVLEIAALLPLLLQLSLMLFFGGLVLFTRIIFPSISWHIILLVGAWFIILCSTTWMSVYSPSCPYKTPFLNTLVKTLLLKIHRFLNRRWRRWRRASQRQEDRDETVPFNEEDKVARSAEFDVDLLLNVYNSTKDIKIWEMVTRCVDLNSPRHALATFRDMVEKRFGSPIKPWSDLSGCYDLPELRLLLRSISTSVRRAFLYASHSEIEYEFGTIEADALVILDRLQRSLRCERSSDRGLSEIVRALLRESLHPQMATDDYYWRCFQSFPSAARLPSRVGIPLMNSLIKGGIGMLLLNGDPDNDPPIENPKIPPHKLLELCRRLFLCAGRSSKDTLYFLWLDFPRLTTHFADKMKRLEDPTIIQSPSDVLQWQCLLDMAMRLHQRVPGIIDKSLFEVLHSRSIKMFDVLDWRGRRLDRHIQRKEDVRGNVPNTPLDWERVLRGGEYVEVDVRGRRQYKRHGGKWDYQSLRSECKHRIEFLLNFWPYHTSVRSILEQFEF
ncbi:hypothetical protein NLI96_g4397 [Meripilus lineatus]|uniref:DUF6535 domain-containing protein n=1 Tax=Meripilus lineatus TaxID=2056292 RepID=A0AAD5V509_9APHY|nr:hypothetical protein NLI96_g4397 [Physisporinus lineatus]